MTEYWVYMLHCNNGSYYTGYTTDLTRRYQEHLTGTDKCKYTRSFKPIGIAQCWKTEDKILALRAERFIKKLPKNKKQQLVFRPEQLMDYLQNTIIHPTHRLSTAPLIAL